MNYGVRYGNEIYDFVGPETRFERKRFNHNIMVEDNTENYWEENTNYTVNNVSTDKRVCYNCNKPGHIKRDCPNQIKTPISKNMKRENSQRRKGQRRFSRSRSRDRYGERRRSPSPYYKNNRGQYWKGNNNVNYDQEYQEYQDYQKYPPNQAPRYSNTHTYYHNNNVTFKQNRHNNDDVDEITNNITNINLDNQYDDYPLIDLDD
jgi:hypothetical protein